jgi:hypothetical protein
MKWYWVGYTDPSAPKGQQAKGAAVIRGWSEEEAVAALRTRGIPSHNVSWDAHVGVVPESWGNPPYGQAFISRLINAVEADKLARSWDPQHRGLAGADDIRDAFLNDDAAPGDPLFGKKAP